MTERIVKYIEEFGSITTKEAFTKLGCTRLSEYIRRIRLIRPVNDEWISGKNRYGEPVHYKKYYF